MSAAKLEVQLTCLRRQMRHVAPPSKQASKQEKSGCELLTAKDAERTLHVGP